jgi:predicted RNase H-like nuclease (RuvC/YqgF family)
MNGKLKKVAGQQEEVNWEQEKKIKEFQKQNDKLKSKNTILSKAISRLINEKKELEEQLKIK